MGLWEEALRNICGSMQLMETENPPARVQDSPQVDCSRVSVANLLCVCVCVSFRKTSLFLVGVSPCRQVRVSCFTLLSGIPIVHLLFIL